MHAFRTWQALPTVDPNDERTYVTTFSDLQLSEPLLRALKIGSDGHSLDFNFNNN